MGVSSSERRFAARSLPPTRSPALGRRGEGLGHHMHSKSTGMVERLQNHTLQPAVDINDPFKEVTHFNWMFEA